MHEKYYINTLYIFWKRCYDHDSNTVLDHLHLKDVTIMTSVVSVFPLSSYKFSF